MTYSPEPEQMQAVVLMGGLGTRLGALAQGKPKALMDVLGKPFFAYQLECLIHAGFKRFLFCVGYQAEMIVNTFGDGSSYGVEIQYSFDGEKPLGTGGALRKAIEMLDEDFMLIYGDSFMDIDYAEVLYRYGRGREAGMDALMTVMENHNRFDKSNVIFQNGEIVLYSKTVQDPAMNAIDYGVSVFRRSLFAAKQADEKFDLAEIQSALSREGKLAGCEITHRFYEIGNGDSLHEFIAYAQRRWHTPNRAVFLDRDGVINQIVYNEDTEQLDSPMDVSQFHFLPGVIDGLRALSQKGYLLFVATNQPSAAKGKTTLAKLYDINCHMVKALEAQGITMEEVQMCPHFGKASPRTQEDFLIQECDCRKPKPGLIRRILEKYCIDAAQSYMAGDSYTDILAGQAAGLRTAFIGKYKCDVCQLLGETKPDLYCHDLQELSQAL